MSTTELTYPLEIYQINDDENIRLNAKIGHPQLGLITVVNDGENLVTERKNLVKNLSLGKGIDLRNKLLEIKFIVDKSGDENNVIVTYTLEGEESTLDRTRPYKFINDQRTVIFKIEIQFQ